MVKKLGWWMALALVACGGEPDDGTEEAEVAELSPAQAKGPGGGGRSCTVEQCNGSLNPFGTCASSTPLGCSVCVAPGGHTGYCTPGGGCAERCPPPPKTTK